MEVFDQEPASSHRPLPVVVMLWLALYQRIRQYGFTEPRYFLLALSVWLGAAALFFGVTRSRRIRLIPISLILLTLLDFAGPWSSHDVARRSELSRLEDTPSAQRRNRSSRPPPQFDATCDGNGRR